MLTRLLLASREGRGRQVVQGPRQVQPHQHLGRPLPRLRALDAARHQRLGHDVARGDARHGAQELADIGDGAAAQREHEARIA